MRQTGRIKFLPSLASKSPSDAFDLQSQTGMAEQSAVVRVPAPKLTVLFHFGKILQFPELVRCKVLDIGLPFRREPE